MSEEVKIGKKFINIGKILKEKNPSLYKKLPKFIIRLIEIITRVDGFNHYIYEWRECFGEAWVDIAIKGFNIELTTSGLENIPKEGNPMIVSNHPLGGFDGVALMSVVTKIRPDLKFPVNDILLKLPGIVPLIIPINKHGRNTENIQTLDTVFASDIALLFFPAGLVSRLQKEGIRDLEWKHTFITKSVNYQRDLIPTFIYAYNSPIFYKIAKWRKMLGIKANLEMLLLSREVFKQRNGKIHIHFGKPIPYTTFDKSKSKKEWAAWTREQVYTMAIEEGFKLK